MSNLQKRLIRAAFWAVYKSGTGTWGRVCGDLGLGNARRGTCGTGTRGGQ